MTNAEDKLTVIEVARELNRSLEQVRRYVREGQLPGEKLGRQWFVERKAPEDFQARHAGQSTDVLTRARGLRESIKKRVGTFNVAEMVAESRQGRRWLK